MKFKKIFLGTLTTLISLTPPAVLISCSGGENKDGSLTLGENTLNKREKAKKPLGIINKSEGWKSVLSLGGPDEIVNDKSFAESAYNAINDSEIKKIIPLDNPYFTRPTSNKDISFVDMYASLSDKSLIIAPGYLHIEPLKSKQGVNAIKNKAVILVDGDVKASNIAAILYKSHQSGFMVGYMAGIYLNEKYKTFKENGLKVGTFGGMNIEPVTLFMMGFQNGIKYFNANKGNYKHEIDFIDNGSKVDYFSGDFTSGKGTPIVENLLSKSADLIFPVAGVQTKDVMSKLKETNNSTTKIIGVDVAQELDPTFKDYVIFSAIKKIKEGIMKVIEIITGNKTNQDQGYNSIEGFGGLTIGDLDNDLVGASQGLPSNKIAKKAWDETQKKEIKDAAKSLEYNPFRFDY